MDEKERRHDLVLEELVKRLAQHKGFLFLKQPYYSMKKGERVQRGEYDVMRITSNSQYKKSFTYYEVKGKDSPIAYQRALKQFSRHKIYNPVGNWRYVYVTPEKVERVRL